MNLVIITTSRQMYHQYLCAEVAKQHRVVAVLHPTETGMTWRKRRILPAFTQWPICFAENPVSVAAAVSDSGASNAAL
ncbi:MAG: hypothetical protein M3P18_24030 [Actinomycetota bacterium]|nr:hypothetical protein [Actinomycetota bacterium]